MLSLGRIIIFVIFIFWGCSKKDNTLIQQVLPLFLANNHFNSSDSNPPPTNNPTSIPISIKYNSQSYVFIKGKNIIEVLPTVTGTILSYSINPSLPQGLSFQTENGKISGVASIESPATSYTITAFDKDGITTSTSIMIQIALPESYIELSNTSSPSTYSISIDETIWLSFDTVSGKKYSVHWLDSYNGSGNETADIVVSAYKSNKKDSYFLKADSGNIPGVIFLAAETDKVYLKVQAINSNSIGSFKLWIEQVPEQIVSTPLIVDEAAKTYNLKQKENVLFSFFPTKNKEYKIRWDDSYEGSGIATADISVSAYIADNSINYFTRVDSGYNAGKIITGFKEGKVYLKVEGYSSGDYGSFKIWIESYESPSTKLTVDAAPQSYSISENGMVKFYFYASSYTNYRVKWADKTDGTGSQSADVKVSAYYEYSDGSGVATPFTSVDKGLFPGQIVQYHGSGGGGNINLRVEGITSTTSGSFQIWVEKIQTYNLPAFTTLTVDASANTYNIAGDTKYFSFAATSGNSYKVYWADKMNGTGSQTADIKVSAYTSAGSSIFFSSIDNGYNGSLITASATETIRLRVDGVSTTETGTFQVWIESESGTQLTVNAPASTYTLNAGSEMLFFFNATVGSFYKVKWADKIQGTGSETADILVSSDTYFSYTDSGYSGQIVPSSITGKISINVKGINTTETGSFKIWIETYVPPSITVDAGPQQYTIQTGETLWFSFIAQADKKYYIKGEDSFVEFPIETASVVSSAYKPDTTSYFTEEFLDSTIGNSIISSTNQTIYIRIDEYGEPGTFKLWVEMDPNYPPVITQLTIDASPSTYNLIADTKSWFSFQAEQNKKYIIKWTKIGSGTELYDYTYVSAYRSDKTISYFSFNSDGFPNGQVVTAQETGTIYLKAEAWGSYFSGTFQIYVQSYESTITPLIVDASSDTYTLESNEIQTFYFNSQFGKRYIVKWADSFQGTENETVDIQVSAFNSDGSVYYFNSIDSGYSVGRNVIAVATENTYITVSGKVAGNNGTYKIWVELDPTYTIPSLMVNAAAQTYNLVAQTQMWFSFSTESGKQYNIKWDDSYEGSGTKTADIKVSAYTSDGSNSYFTEADSGYNTGVTITSTENGKVYLIVEGYSSLDEGTYSINVTGL